MADFDAIGTVSAGLQERLEDGIENGENGTVIVENASVELTSPAEAAESGAALSVFLYRVTENSAQKNAPQTRVGPTTRRPAPLSLDLHYLLTAYPTGEGDTYQNSHTLLGRAMQILHDDPVLNSIDGTETYVSVYPRTMDELADIWSTFAETPYQPSVAYIATPVAIDASPQVIQPVVERRFDDGSDGSEP